MISADFGQINDYTAVAITKRRLVEVGEPYQFVGGGHLPPRRRIYETRQNVEQHYDLIRLDRVALRTPYTTIAQGIVRLIKEMYRTHVEALGSDVESGVVRLPHDTRKPLRVGLAIDDGRRCQHHPHRRLLPRTEKRPHQRRPGGLPELQATCG